MSVFEKTGKDVEYYRYSADKEKIDVHMCIEKDIIEDLNKIVAVYKAYGFDKTNKTELCAMVLSDFIANLNDETATILELMGKMKDYRERNSNYFNIKSFSNVKLPEINTDSELNNRMELL